MHATLQFFDDLYLYQEYIGESMQHEKQYYKNLFLDLTSACGCNTLY